MFEQVCQRCRRVCFSERKLADHQPCESIADKLEAEIALAQWDGRLAVEEEGNHEN